ncbi:MAG: helix-turn-helix transcriptional regulator, partial [Rhodospirillales bacterium]|nr:helix-turn-helix transcriptional regulator [Rhodospirillales bacterium]
MNFPETLSQRSGCPISTTLDILGDKWSLIIIRDMLTGKSRYGEFQDSPEGIPTNILAARLKRLG